MPGLVYALLTAIAWAVAVVLFRRAGEIMPPLALNVHKNAIAAVLISATLIVAGEPPWPSPEIHDVLLLLGSGVVGLAVADTVFFHSLNLLGASRSAIVDALYVPCVLVLSYLYLGERLVPVHVLGAALVVGGVLITVGDAGTTAQPSARSAAGVLLGVLAMAMMAGAIVIVKPILAHYSVLWVTWMRMVGGVAGMLVFGLLRPAGRQGIVLGLRPQRAWRFAVPGTIAGTYLAMILWIAGFKYANASLAAILNQTSTLWTVLLARLFLGEPLTARRVVAVAMAVAGGLLVVT